ncbi:NADPH-dependent FMN reductase [Aciduricibacillus chroicocephali]|uniref:NADPH-dependent FMN reductase n=1 Tax=Aciduricibacillus chroicocephali TaxID=3054939 RepID=A0ABY9KWU9_9BACI|nr:NADPH-dependent FMN reductase [Bacillaceae bacterium 44XB]
MNRIAIISGSPFAQSRTDCILRFLSNELEGRGCDVSYISVRDVPAHDLMECRFDSPAILNIINILREADGVIVGSPVYQAAYSGALKALIDLMPMNILEGTPVLPLMTGGSKAHLLALEYSLKPLLATLKAHNLKGVYLIDKEIDKESEQPILDEDTYGRTMKQIEYFLEFTGKISGKTIEN